MKKRTSKNWLMHMAKVSIWLVMCLFFNFNLRSQTTYVSEGFNNSLTQFSVTNGTAAYRTGNSGTGDRPASSPYAFEGTHGFSCVNTSITLQSNVINTQGICGAILSFDLAAFSLGTTTNGLDGTDVVRVDISPDNGTNYYRTLDINGNGNAFWAYSATGVASTAYDGNATAVVFAPGGGGSRTTDGYSTVQITNLPNVAQLLVRIYLTNNSGSEGWLVDDFKIQGNPPSAMATSPAVRCTPGTLTLGATADGCGMTPTIAWYANSTGGTSLQSNTTNPSSFTTPSINATTSYYVEQQYNVGLGVGTNTGNVTTTGVGVAFNVHTAFTLNSLVIRTRKSSNADGSLTVLIKNSIGTVVSTHNLVVPGVSGNNNNVTYNIGYAFSPGIYTMEVSAMSANISRVYFTAGVAYPLNYGVVSFTGNVGNGAGSYNYFYDWNISLPRQEVVATIGSNVTPSVSITSSDADNSICSGTSVTFTATPINGGSAPSYQWKLNGANVGTNSTTYINSALANSDVVTVVMTANNACQTSATANGNSITTFVSNTVSPSVSIVSNDADNFVCNGTSVTFTATATNGGSSPTYHWKVNGSAVGTSSTSYSSNALVDGDIVTVEMTANNSCQTQSLTVSNSITIGVGAITNPIVVLQSSDLDNSVCQGGAITYTAVPTNGGSAPSYQWVLNGNNVGTNSPTFNNAVTANQVVSVIMTSNYECQTSNTATSNTISTIVNPMLSPSVTVTSSDADNAICAGELVTFTATPTNGGPAPSYQWKLNGANVGTNASTYATSTLPNNGTVSVVMTANNECQFTPTANGNNINTSVTNNVTPSVVIASPFATNSGNATWAMTTVNATNVANVSISALTQNNNNGTTTMLVNNSNSAGYTGASGGNNAAAAVQNGAFNVSTSTYFQFVVTPSPTYTFTISNISFGTRSTATGPLSYALRSSLDNYASDIFTGSITNNSTWILKSHAPTTGNVSGIGQAVTYRLYAYGGTGGTINNANWRVDDLVVSFVNAQSICEGTSATFTANPTNGGNPTYNWSVNGISNGVTSSSWTTSSLNQGDVIGVTMTADNTCQTVSTASNVVTALINAVLTPSVSIVSSLGNSTGCLGASITFTASPNNGGTVPTYQWKLNGVNVGTNNVTYSNANLMVGDAISCQMTANNACQTSALVTSNSITPQFAPTILTTTSASNCGPAALTLSATSSCGLPGATTEWFANASGGAVLGTGSSFTTPVLSTTTNYYVEENFIAGEITYGASSSGTFDRGLQFDLIADIVLNAVNIQTNGACNVTIQLWNSTINAPLVIAGNTYSITRTLVNGGNTVAIGWNIPAGNGYRIVVTNITAGRNLTRTTTYVFPKILPGVGEIIGNVDTGGADRYNYFYNWDYSTIRQQATATIVNPVTPAVAVISSDPDNSICAGTSVTFTATPTNGGTTPAYQWKLNGNSVGSNIATYSNSALSNNDVVTVVMTANNTCQTISSVNANSISTAVLSNANYYLDEDGDTYGETSTLVTTCIQPAGYTTEPGDCDDENSDAYPFNLEVCNASDDDCDGVTDNGISTFTFYADLDEDGYGSNTASIVSCDYVAGYIMSNGDCNDANASVNPLALELCSTSYDDDCDGWVNESCNLTNDDPLFSNLIIPSTSLVNCNTVTGNLGGASPSTQVGIETLTGNNPDVWFYFTASSPGVTIRCIPNNDVKLELRTGAGALLKSSDAMAGVGDEYLNFGELTTGGQYYVRIIQQDSPSLGGAFSLCTRRITSSGNLNYTNSILYDSGCDIVYASSITGSTTCSIQLTPIAPTGGAVISATGSSIPLANFTGTGGEKFQYNTTYQALITLGFTLPTGNGGTEIIQVSRVSDNNLVVQQHQELDLGSVHSCPNRVSIGGIIRANLWLCDAVRYQWKFEKTVNGVVQLVNGNPVIIEVLGPLGTRDFVPTALMGFTAGSEWRVQVRPIFANNVVGSYGTNYQCMKFKGTAAAMPTVQEDEASEKSLAEDEALDLVLYPNPSGRASVRLSWSKQDDLESEVVVRDMQGRVITRIENIQGNLIELNGSSLSGGMYSVEWKSGTQTQRLRWLVQ